MLTTSYGVESFVLATTNMFDLIELKKQLPKSEFTLLELLISKNGEIVTRDEIAAFLYPDSNLNGVSNESIDQTVSRLRKSIGEKGNLIKTKARVGYYLDTTNPLNYSRHYIKKKGAFIVFYGAHNVGKTVQIMKLVEKLSKKAHQSFMLIKYPIYNIEPTGPIIHEILYGPNKSNIDHKSLEFQKLNAQNKIDFQHTLIEILNKGIDVIAEGYVGTGIAKGLTWGLELKELENINFGVIEPDCAILLDGMRHEDAIEQGNKFEGAGKTIWERNRLQYKFLAEKYGWITISNDSEVEEVNINICNVLQKYLNL